MTDDWRMDRIGSALRGENPAVLRRLDAGFAVAGDVQFLPGYSVLHNPLREAICAELDGLRA